MLIAMCIFVLTSLYADSDVSFVSFCADSDVYFIPLYAYSNVYICITVCCITD